MQIKPDDLLLVIDVQNDFCPGVWLAVGDGDAVGVPESVGDGLALADAEADESGEADCNGTAVADSLDAGAADPVATAARWARFAGLIPGALRDGLQLETARGRIFIGTRAAIAKKLGAAPPAPAIAGYAFACRHPEKLAARCKAAGIKVQKHGKRYSATLPKALGGAWLFG